MAATKRVGAAVKASAVGTASDNALLAAHIDGDPDAFTELVRRHRDRLCGADVTADSGTDGPAPVTADLPDLDEDSLPGAVGGLVTGGEGDEPLMLEGTTAPEDCVPGLQVEEIDELIGVIEIRFSGRNRDAVFFTTSDPGVARVIVVDDCSLDDPEIVDILQGQL